LFVGVGVGVAFFRRGEAVGDGVGVAFFADGFRCLWAGLGVGVGARIFLILLPNDSSAAGVVEALDKSPPSRRQQLILLRVIDLVGRYCETPVTGV